MAFPATCASCKFYELTQTLTSITMGNCRRYPKDANTGKRPEMRSDDTCGEHTV